MSALSVDCSWQFCHPFYYMLSCLLLLNICTALLFVIHITCIIASCDFKPWTHTSKSSFMLILYNKIIFFIFSRGIAHSSVDALHPLPERPEESLPLSYIETVRNGNFTSFTPDTSGRSSPTTDNTPSIVNSFSESNTWSTNTGILTGRSSVYSWGNEDVSLTHYFENTFFKVLTVSTTLQYCQFLS